MPDARAAAEGRDTAEARAAVQALAAIEDARLRRGILLARLGELDAGAAAALLDGLLALAAAPATRPAAAGAAAREALVQLADTPGVAAVRGQARLAAILEAARDAGRIEVVRLLAERRGRRMGDGPDAQPERTSMDHVPLGWRKQLGRTGSRDVLDRLLYDQQPSVIENLLANPRLTEREVVRIAAHRPTSAAILGVIFRHPRWLARYRVKRALALNPYTAPAQAASLLPSLLTQDLEAVAADETLHPEVSAAARNLLDARRSRPG